ncbi:MAG: exo-alpha-sialidase [Candidatus Latescibacteria bacterium]|jgi:hypothetical protein|nr:exo-alpha-sialidase [Candidatus Latescibacterota bacterium]
MKIDFQKIASPVFQNGTRQIAYRDPAGHYHNGIFRVFHTQVHRKADGGCYIYTAVTKSDDLITWTEPEILTPKDQTLNYSSPGNVICYNNKWILCYQTYPTPENQSFGDQTSRVFTTESDDLDTWSEPELIRVKGPDVAREDMGRMIDPYLIPDKDVPSRWWCFYKQNGASMSYSNDLKTWTYFGNVKAGENVCVLIENNEYIMFHSPSNGVGIKRSKDLQNWTDHGLLTLGQDEWPWAQGRLTAGHVLDLRAEKGIGKYIMFFHGSSKEGKTEQETHGHSCLAIAWSDDLINWEWPKG